MRRKTALNLIEKYTNAGYTISKISRKCRIATSTISKWYHDACPTPRTLARLQFLNTEIEQYEREISAQIQRAIWEENGGIERVRKFWDWKDKNGHKLRNDHPEFDVAFPHWEEERKHESAGRHFMKS